uniref:CEP63/Deup1 CEP152 binding coiled coil domain-containing protein n=1 Tax=Terrapene triunguis TaxID=2587831 RepID=A0A674K638_9SAUR
MSEYLCYKTMEFKAGLSEMRNELQSRDALWRGMEAEFQQLRKELFKIGECKNIQENQMKLQSAYAQCIQELENKKAELLHLEQHQESQQKELKKIRDHLYHEEQSHSSEQERMRTEISDLTEELHQKEITIATIMEKATLLERKLKMELEIKEKLLAKQQVCKQAKKKKKKKLGHSPTIDLSNTEHENYTASIHELECENERLRNNLGKLQSDSETSILLPPEMSLPTTATEKFFQEEEKRAKEFEEILNSHIEELQRHSENTVKKYARLKHNRHI